MEKDFFDSFDAVLEYADEPQIFQVLGEFEVMLRQEDAETGGTFIQVYRTRTMERAMLMWCILVIERRSGQMRRGDRLYGLGECRNLLRAWAPESYQAKYQGGGGAAAEQQRRRQRRQGQRHRQESAESSDPDDPTNLDAVTELVRKMDAVRTQHAESLRAHVQDVGEFS